MGIVLDIMWIWVLRLLDIDGYVLGKYFWDKVLVIGIFLLGICVRWIEYFWSCNIMCCNLVGVEWMGFCIIDIKGLWLVWIVIFLL